MHVNGNTFFTTRDFLRYISYTVITGSMLVLMYGSTLEIIIDKFSMIKYEEFADPISHFFNYFIIVFFLSMNHAKLVRVIKKINLRIHWYIWLLNAAFDILILPLSMLIVVIYYNHFPPEGYKTGLLPLSTVEPFLSLAALYILKGLITPALLKKRKKQPALTDLYKARA